METLDFLRAVLPSAGHGLYCAMSGKTKKHFFAKQVEDLIPQFEKMVGQKSDAYFALAAYATDESRKASNAQYLRALFIDMDGYDTPQDAWKSLVIFLKATELWALGKPYAVVSGGGLHAYWPLTRDLEVAEWEPLARNLKRLCQQEKLKIDPVVTADAARILRPPGTFNFKPSYPQPLPVALVKEGATFDPQTLGEAIAAKLVGENSPPQKPTNVIPLSLAGARPDVVAPSSATTINFKNQTTLFKNIVVKTEAGDGCGQLAYYKENATDDGMEPLWRALLSIAKKCEDGWEYAVQLTDLHGYEHEKLKDRWQRLEDYGPQWCKTFKDLNPEPCKNCKHWGTRLNNPIMLGRETLKTTKPAQIEVEVESDHPTQPTKRIYDRPEAPPGFWYGEHGGIITEVGEKKTKFEIQILAYDLYAIGMFRSKTGEHTVNFVAHHPQGVIDFNIPMKMVASKDETIKLLTERNIVAQTMEATIALHRYVFACASMASQERRAIALPEQYGWQDDGSFIFAGRKFARGRKPMQIPLPEGLANVVVATQPKGTLEGFKRVINFMIERKLYRLLCVVLLAAGAPLMRFTGLHGLVVHCASRESGTGKSFALDVASAVWGEPRMYKVNNKTSSVAMQHRIGLLNSLPMTSDELTTLTREHFGWFPDFLLSFTEGKGKERMKSGTNEERLNHTTWSTIALLSSNGQCADLLLAQRHAVEGELRRLLEFHIDEELQLNDQETEIVKSIHDNYGVVGYMLAEYLSEANPDELRDLVTEAVSWGRAKLNSSGAERFWTGGIGCALHMGVIWKELGIAKLPLDKIFAEYAVVVNQLRAKITGGRRTGLDVLNTYIEENSGNLVVLDYTAPGSNVAFFDGVPLLDRTKTNQLAGRVEHKVNKKTEITISVERMRLHCSSMSFSFDKLLSEIDGSGSCNAYLAKRSIGKGTRVPTTPCACVVVTMDRAMFDELDKGQAAVGES